MKNIGLACVLSVLGVMTNSLVAQALDFKFTLVGTTYSKMGSSLGPGKVTGVIQGLKDNDYSSPTSIIINSNSLGIPEGTVLVKAPSSVNYGLFTYETHGSFAVENGKVLRVRDMVYENSSEVNDSTSDYVIVLGGEESYLGRNNRVTNVTNGRSTTGWDNVKYTPITPTKVADTSSKPKQYEVRLRLFIPSPAAKVVVNDTVCNSINNAFCVFGGDNRRFSYNAPSHRYIANAIVTTNPKSNSQIIGIPFRNFCPTNRYLPSQSFHSLKRPSWWLDLNSGAKPIETKKLEFDTKVNEVNSVNATFVPGENNTVKVSFKVSGSNPLVYVAPAFDANINVFIQDKPGQKPLVRVEGMHDGFPAYEIYINGQLVYGYDPEKEGGDLSNLFPPLDVTISKPWTQWNLIKNKYSEQKLPSCEINFGGFGGGSSGGGGASGNY